MGKIFRTGQHLPVVISSKCSSLKRLHQTARAGCIAAGLHRFTHNSAERCLWSSPGRRGFRCVLTLLVTISFYLATNVAVRATSEWVSIKTLPGFADANAQLQALVNRKGHHAVNRLCVVGQRDGAHFQAEVYWPSENKLILWVPNVNDPETLVHSKRYLDLTRDVRNDPGTSTYLLSRSFVKEVQRACPREGDQFLINRDSARAPDHG